VGDLVRTFPGLTVSEIHYPGSGAIKEICIVDRSAIRSGAVAAGGSLGGAASLAAQRSASGSPPRLLSDMAGNADLCIGAAVALDEVLIGGSPGEFLRSFPTTGIESIIYLKPSDASGRYGLAGANGVVLIYTKGNGPTVVREQ
jgi:hypothetical protein